MPSLTPVSSLTWRLSRAWVADMNNRQIARQVRDWQRVRADWIDILVKNPGSRDAPVHIMSINSKIELLQNFWNWSDETVDFPL